MSYFSINNLCIYKGYLIKVVHINVHSDISNINIYIQQKSKSRNYNIKFACTISLYAKIL